MPRIQSARAVESTVTGWQTTRERPPSLMSLRPKYETSDAFKTFYGRLPYREDLNMAQIYTGDSRQAYLRYLKDFLHKLPGECTLQLRWRVSKEVPAFSMDFLLLYLSRFAKVEAIYQTALNSCLVVFKDVQNARIIANNRQLGLHYGRLYAKWWHPHSQDKTYLASMQHIEKAAETRLRFHSLLDRDDRVSYRDTHRLHTRNIAEANKTGGPNLYAYLCEGVKLAAAQNPLPQPPPRIERHYDRVEVVASTTKMDNLLEKEKLTVMKFSAAWCFPCKSMAPIFEQLAVQMTEVQFLKVDVDTSPDLAEEYNISALPTFVFVKNGERLDHIMGADPDLLKDKITKYSKENQNS